MERTRKRYTQADVEKRYSDHPIHWSLRDREVVRLLKKMAKSEVEKFAGPVDVKEAQRLEMEFVERSTAGVLDESAEHLAKFMAKQMYKKIVSVNARQEALLEEVRETKEVEFQRVDNYASELLEYGFTSEQVARFKRVAHEKYVELTR